MCFQFSCLLESSIMMCFAATVLLKLRLMTDTLIVSLVLSLTAILSLMLHLQLQTSLFGRIEWKLSRQDERLLPLLLKLLPMLLLLTSMQRSNIGVWAGVSASPSPFIRLQAAATMA